MEDVNPYAAPKHDLPLNAEADEPESGPWRDGELLVIHNGAAPPDRCVICNAPAEGQRLKLSMRWLAPFHLLGVAIPIVERRATIKVGICPWHRWRRRRAIAASWLIATLSLISMFSWHYVIDVHGGRWFATLLYATCGITLIAAVTCEAIFSAPPVKPQKIEGSCVWLKRVHPEYLAQLPPFTRAA